MRIHLVYVVAGTTDGAPPPEVYRPGYERFIRTLFEFDPGDQINLLLVNSNGGLTNDMRRMLPWQEGFKIREVEYRGTGWDVGAQQFAAQFLPLEDYMICFSSWAHFAGPKWLERYQTAIRTHGDSLYGSMTSDESARHIRGTGYCLRVESYLQYPHLIDSRQKTFDAEFGPDSLTNWFVANKRGAFLVTFDGIYSQEHFRTPDNIFRRGNQSVILNRDKHSLIYDEASPEEKIRLSKLSDGEFNPK